MEIKLSELRNLTKDELDVKLSALKAELFSLRYQAETARIEKPHRIREIRRTIARINTLIREEELKNAAGAKKAA